jgi:uncharacterized membrane protein
MSEEGTFPCQICRKECYHTELFPAEQIRPIFNDFIRLRHPEWTKEGYLCFEDLRKLRREHVAHLVEKDRGELSELDQSVFESLKEHELLSQNINSKFERTLSFGEKIADKVAHFGGSWTFILGFFGVLMLWMLLNLLMVESQAFDPYPFIFLNLVLSCLAAIQAPVIMMSQNRQAERERLRADDDYCTNLKAELEIRQLHAKLDQFMKKQWERILELQQIQIDLAEEFLDHKKKSKD